MKSLLLSSLLTAVLARPQGYETPAPPATPPQTPYFTAIAARSASPIHFRSFNAIGGKFFLGGEPSSYCPEVVGDVCDQYPGNETVLASGFGSLSLGVVVPGGQQAYVAPDGALQYTQAHSSYVPTGSIREGWTREFRDDPTDIIGYLFFKDGLVACSRNDTETGEETWQVYGQIENFTAPSTECLGFSLLTVNVTDAGAWQY